jgi:pyrimidine-nucleoside phosphorylase
VYGIIKTKRDGGELSKQQITQFIREYVAGTVPDYQASALLMALFLRGLNSRETADLTQAMVDSGDVVDLSSLPGLTVDKHSTGGVGDKTTLVLGPLLAAAGLTVAKMSGRGLGHTGGTLDKLEAIPGLSTQLSAGEMVAQVRRIGIAVIAQTARLVPADRLLYALRDVTATVDSLPLIASSIMSKKLAAGAHAIVLDVKTGSGAFMQTTDKAFELARAMIEIGTSAGRAVVAVVSNMNQPLGRAVGNALEVEEAIQILRGDGPDDLRELCLVLGSQLLQLAENEVNEERARRHLVDVLDSGAALTRFRDLVVAQGGDGRVVDAPESVLPRAVCTDAVTSPGSGYIQGIDALRVGEAARVLGAGRLMKDDIIDPAAGVRLSLKVGDAVSAGQEWASIYAPDAARLAEGSQVLSGAITVSIEKPAHIPLVFGLVDRYGRETRW